MKASGNRKTLRILSCVLLQELRREGGTFTPSRAGVYIPSKVTDMQKTTHMRCRVRQMWVPLTAVNKFSTQTSCLRSCRKASSDDLLRGFKRKQNLHVQPPVQRSTTANKRALVLSAGSFPRRPDLSPCLTSVSAGTQVFFCLSCSGSHLSS